MHYKKPFQIPKIQDLLLKLEGSKYTTSLDLNMGCYYYYINYEYQRDEQELTKIGEIVMKHNNTLDMIQQAQEKAWPITRIGYSNSVTHGTKHTRS